MNVGLDLYYAPYSGAAQLPPPPKAGRAAHRSLRVAAAASRPPPTGALFEPAFYAELEATPWPGGRIVPGLRLDYTKATKPGTSRPASSSGRT